MTAVSIKATGSVCGDIAITAAEGGTNYWARVISARDNGIGYDYKRWSPDYLSNAYIKGEVDSSNVNVPDDFVFYQLRAMDDHGADITDSDDKALNEPITVTPELIRRGIDLFLVGVRYTEDNGPASLVGQWNFEPRGFDDMKDLGAMDATEADCVIQLGAFGRLVFG